MGKCYCDYCDVFLTHDSVAVRKQHNDGNRHKQNVCDYYRQFIGLKTQRLIDEIVAAFDEKVARGLIQPSYGFPSLNGAAPTREDPASTNSNEPQPGDTTGIEAPPESNASPNEPDDSGKEADLEKPLAEMALLENNDKMKEDNSPSGKTDEISKDAQMNANQQPDLGAHNTVTEHDQELNVKPEDDDGSDFEFVEVRAG